MIPGDEWKCEGRTPTEQDCRKYAQCKTRLLIASQSGIFEVKIADVTPGGIVRVGFGGAGMGCFQWMWMRPEDIQILEILPDPVEAPEKSSDPFRALLYGEHQ